MPSPGRGRVQCWNRTGSSTFTKLSSRAGFVFWRPHDKSLKTFVMTFVFTSRAVRFALSVVLPSCHSSNSTVCYFYRHVMSGCQFYRSRMKHAIIFYFQITGAWGIWGGGGHDISFDLGPSSIIPVGIYLVYYILQVYIYTQLSPIGEQSTPLLDYRLLHAIRTNCIYFFTNNIMYTVNML